VGSGHDKPCHRCRCGLPYGVISNESTVRMPPPTVKSLTSGRKLTPIDAVWVATTVPSIEKTTCVGCQSMR
jgi:hypothetical protein